jgi:hypothetical protein
MINMETRTKKEPHDIVAKAVSAFGENGLGLEVVEQSECCARFRGGGGFVSLTLDTDAETDETVVGVTGREYEQQIKSFLATL